MEEEEANKDEAESKNKQLLTRLMLVIVPGWIIGCQLDFHDDDYEHLHMAFRASRHQMDTDNSAKHVYVDGDDDNANNNDGDDDSHLDPDTLAKRDHPSDAEHYRQVVEQHLPRANTNTNTNTNKMQIQI